MYQILKKRGENGRPVLLKTYQNEEDARQYLLCLKESLFQKCLYEKKPERQYHTELFWGNLLTYYTPSWQSVWVYIKQTNK